MVGAWVAAAVVTLVQFLRLRDRRLLPLAALFAFEAQALGREWFDVWKDVYQIAACLAGLALVAMLTLRPAPAPPPPRGPEAEARPAAGDGRRESPQPSVPPDGN